MRKKIRKWICEHFNLIGGETQITVHFQGITYLNADLQTLKCMDDLKLLTHKDVDRKNFENIVFFRWSP